MNKYRMFICSGVHCSSSDCILREISGYIGGGDYYHKGFGARQIFRVECKVGDDSYETIKKIVYADGRPGIVVEVDTENNSAVVMDAFFVYTNATGGELGANTVCDIEVILRSNIMSIDVEYDSDTDTYKIKGA